MVLAVRNNAMLGVIVIIDSSQTSDNERIRQRRKNIDDSSNRQSEYRGCRSE